MNAVHTILQKSLEKKDQPFERFFKIDKLNRQKLAKNDLLYILQYAHALLSIVEELEDRNPKWQCITNKQVYELLKAIISLNALPDKTLINKYYPEELTECELIGFLYVAHQFQFSAYQFGCNLRCTQPFHEAAFRAFNTPIATIKAWDLFIEALSEHNGKLISKEVENGIQMALQIIEPNRGLKERLISQNSF